MWRESCANPTDAEKRLWSHLRGGQLGERFTRQHPIGSFVVDFACRSARLAIELDGGQHSGNSDDDARTRQIEARGYRVIRFWNNDVLQNTDGVLIVIRQELDLARNRTEGPRGGWGPAGGREAAPTSPPGRGFRNLMGDAQPNIPTNRSNR
ncbi:endonuclease domain-containing protein [Novosphingobium sp.]|uniref:endonuclease domain-containing protein n=1 Tax=Novosphingobium sp. TaxID=1874826 RepID=UPI0025FDA0A9|nr:endonuclease domain-containing protein [Novosphingobium sp.]